MDNETTNTAIMVKGVKITKTASIKPDGETPDSEKKKITLVIDFDGVTLASVFEAAVRADVIKWQGNNRDKFDTLTDGETINRKFSAPPVASVTPEQARVAVDDEIAGLETEEERLEYIRDLAKRANVEIDI